MGMNEDRKLPRKMKTTMMTKPIASKSVLRTSLIESLTKIVLS